MMAEVLIHHLDAMRFLCGDLRVVAARAARTLPDVAGETVASIFLETSAGAPIEVTGTMAAPGYPPRVSDRLEIIGTKASAVFERNVLHRLGPDPREIAFDNDEGYQASFDGVIAHFVECLESGARIRDRSVGQHRDFTSRRAWLLGSRVAALNSAQEAVALVRSEITPPQYIYVERSA